MMSSWVGHYPVTLCDPRGYIYVTARYNILIACYDFDSKELEPLQFDR